MTSPLPRECSTTELHRPNRARFVLVPVVGIAQRLGWWVPWENEGLIAFSPAWIDTRGGWVFDVVVGVVVLTTLLHVARVVVSVHARTAKTLLVAPGG